MMDVIVFRLVHAIFSGCAEIRFRQNPFKVAAYQVTLLSTIDHPRPADHHE